MAEVADGQEEHQQIATALDLEHIDVNLFRSKSLWLPVNARGVFGGQVISQALVSATNCVDPAYTLHSLHCYFLLSASPADPIIYRVERTRDGRSYVTRTVHATQRGRTIFVMTCSFQRPEPGQLTHQWPMPSGLSNPEQCENAEAHYEKLLLHESLDPRIRKYAEQYVAERKRSPMAIKTAGIKYASNGATLYMWWFKAKNIPKYPISFQKCILSYMSDSQFIGVVPRTLGSYYYLQGPKQLLMMTSLDHTIWFYDNNFDCGDWLLYVVESPRSGEGRGVVHGRMYTRDGTLVAVTSQEGVIRARGFEPKDPSAGEPKVKL
ncbi:uncharacterized protein FIBRA_03711 [Fibroporia radiculosa]|uniref:Acyl-CoA thioesterase II domain-containing protein n=1 Tax=Fibroporia radiculosa TaxID=599839 RepID=J4GNM5_9APHY|nr:uncharacterized protein FIBRA_03711 [Fibroporia radiculosa]CCM01650.1 predicted protein [Fibroporia radiculosa]